MKDCEEAFWPKDCEPFISVPIQRSNMPKERDVVLRRKNFDSDGILELSGDLDFKFEDRGIVDKKSSFDDALGPIPEIFSEDHKVPDRFDLAPSIRDTERRVNWVLMSVMVIAYSALSLLIGLEMDAGAAIPILLVLASIGLFLGERWIKDVHLRLLGIAWVIISMKILYGAALELDNWVVGSVLPLTLPQVGLALCSLVCLNILLSYRYDSDAVAAQATLVLLAIGSSAGSVAGENGVIIMLLGSIFLLHSIASNRSSGNLAALGIAMSNLWFGMHVATDGFEVGSLTIVALESPLKLFLALIAVNSLNAVMATRFSSSENWFSSGLELLGIGKPGLWGVSVLLSVSGALVVVGSVRENAAFAFAIVALLSLCYFASYLVVRGTDRSKVLLFSAFSILILSSLTTGIEVGLVGIGVGPYWIFSAGTCISLASLLWRYQGKVSDTVLWTGSIVSTALVLVITPLDGTYENGLFLVVMILSTMHIAGGLLSVKRKSASLAGVSILIPWIWPVLILTVYEVIATVSDVNSDPEMKIGSLLEIGDRILIGYLCGSSILAALICSNFKNASLNISSGVTGSSEISAAVKQSNAFNLWNLALWLPVSSTVILFIGGQFSPVEAPIILFSISMVHSLSSLVGARIESTLFIPVVTGLGGMCLQWLGCDASIVILVVGLSVLTPIAIGKWNPTEDWLGFLIQVGPVLILMPETASMNVVNSDLQWLPDPATCVVSIGVFSVITAMQRTSLQQRILPLSTVIIVQTTLNSILSFLDGRLTLVALSLTAFFASSIWFVTKGELIRELKSVSEKNRRIREVAASQASLSMSQDYHPVVEESRRKGMKESHGESYIEEVRHFPVVAISVIGIVSISLALYSFLTGPAPFLLLCAGSFLVIIVILEGQRSERIGIRLTDTLGSDTTAATAVIGVSCAVVLGHTNPSSSVRDMTDFGVATALTVMIAMSSLWNSDKGLEARRAMLNWIVYPLASTRIIGFVLIGSLPAPLGVNPFDGNMLSWTYPFVLLEAVLALCIFLDYLIDRRGGHEGHRRGADEVLFPFSVIVLSWGPAGILAAVKGVYSTVKGRRERVAATLALLLPISIVSLQPVLSSTSSLGGYVVVVELLIFICILFACLFRDLDRWIVPALQTSHVLVIVCSFAIFGLRSGILVLFIISSLAWSLGVVKFRKGLRVTGLVDLALATVFGIMIWLSDMDGAWLLAVTGFVSMELAIVLWLSQKNMQSLQID